MRLKRTMSYFAIKILFCVAMFFSFTSAYALEEVLSYNSDITVNKDGSLLVKEEITVNVEHNRIRRGIYRDFPTRYKDNSGNSYVVDFDVVSVTRNGQSEAYFTETLSNGVRVNTGGDNFIPQGTQSFTITYRTQYQLGFFDSHDEIYWNVTGNGWGFTINKASATINLPSEAAFTKQTAYTGSYGSGEQNYSFQKLQPNKAYFETTQALAPGQGFTVVLGWPKGIIIQPPKRQVPASSGGNINPSLFFSILTYLYYGFCAFIAALFLRRFRRNATTNLINTVTPLFEPPADITPAVANYMFNKKNKVSITVITQSIVMLATRKLITVDIKKSGWLFKSKKYSVTRIASDLAVNLCNELTPVEKIVLQELLPYEGSIFTFEHTSLNESKLESLRKKIEKNLKIQTKDFNLEIDAMFMLYTGLAYLVLAIYMVPNFAASFIFLTLFGVALTALSLESKGLAKYKYIFLKPMPSKTFKILEQLEGFKMYLKTAEKNRLNYKYAEELTPDTFERYLPWAIALGVSNEWAKQFNMALERTHQYYEPNWYHGAGRGFNINELNSFSNNLNSAISSAATPPGSSSGFGGGGFSGGGGGGGGGGGR